jgi:hypothetical protein
MTVAAVETKGSKQSVAHAIANTVPRMGIDELEKLAKTAKSNGTKPAELRKLAFCIMNGADGYPMVPGIAYDLLKQAADAGDVEAMACLSYRYANRIGLDRFCTYEQAHTDKKQAEKAYAKHLENADAEAKAYYELVLRLKGESWAATYLQSLEQGKFGFYAQRCVNCNGYFIKPNGAPLQNCVQLLGGMMVHETCPAKTPSQKPAVLQATKPRITRRRSHHRFNKALIAGAETNTSAFATVLSSLFLGTML